MRNEVKAMQFNNIKRERLNRNMRAERKRNFKSEWKDYLMDTYGARKRESFALSPCAVSTPWCDNRWTAEPVWHRRYYSIAGEISHIVHITAYPYRNTHTNTFKTQWQTSKEMEKATGKTTIPQTTALSIIFYSFLFKQRLEGWPFLMSDYGKKLCLLSLPLGLSLWAILDTGLFDQTPTTLRSFLTSLTSNVWHSRLAADQLSCSQTGAPQGQAKCHSM